MKVGSGGEIRLLRSLEGCSRENIGGFIKDRVLLGLNRTTCSMSLAL